MVDYFFGRITAYSTVNEGIALRCIFELRSETSDAEPPARRLRGGAMSEKPVPSHLRYIRGKFARCELVAVISDRRRYRRFIRGCE